jgi:hypothetical protein
MRSATRSSSSSNDNHSNQQQQQQQQGSFSFGGRPTRLPVVSASMSTAFGAAAENQTMEQANERAQYASKAMSSLQLAANVDDEEEADMLLEEARVQLQSAGHAWASRGVEAANEVSDLLGGGMCDDNDSDNDSDGNGNNNPTSELNDLLSDLKLEPTNDDDCSTRFQLYEEHTETVSTIRKALFSFWDNAKEDVPLGAAKESIQSSLDNIDNAENLEVYLNPHYWFVYSMAKKVTSNETKIGIVLKEIQTKLELLASAVDCPICLESIENDDEHTFGCAHKVHKECWQHWSQHCNNIHKTPFCPLCRNDEFLEDILS